MSAGSGQDTQHVPRIFTINLTTLEDEYDNGNTSETSRAVDCSRFTRGVFQFHLESDGTPTDILIELEFSPDGGTTWYKKSDTYWADLRFDDTVCAGAGFNRAYAFDCDGDDFIRFVVTGSGLGVGGSQSFIMDDVYLSLKCR